MEKQFLPVCREDMEKRGWSRVDFVYIIGDAYVDHPSFGPAVISRVLESRGYKVGILSQPDWRKTESVMSYGRPRLGFLVSAGNMDSMVNHYTAAKKKRSQDAYTPGGAIGRRPDRAGIVYGNLIRKAYKAVPIIEGGIEASLRRLAHYDYWSNTVKRSLLLDSSADLISYGMGEHSIVEIAEALDSGMEAADLTFIRGTVYRAGSIEHLQEPVLLPSFARISESKKAYARSFYEQYKNTDPISGNYLAEPYGEKEYVVQNPPALPLTQMEMDDVYALPYTGRVHPSHEKEGGIPAIAEIKFSLTSSRGCFGGCSFCALTFHQGRTIQARSHSSILEEARQLTAEPDFKGYIHDVGGPTANFRHPSCDKQMEKGVCPERQCLFPKPCPNLKADHKDYLSLLEKLRKLPGVKKVFIRSGIRFDYLLCDKDDSFLRELCRHHVSGQLRVAPEHVSDKVLLLMGKPEHRVYEEFLKRYRQADAGEGGKQYVLPYLMSSHPGSDMREAVKLAEYVRDMGYMPEQVQDFYPTPSTLSTCMYYTGLDPRTMEGVYVPRSAGEKDLQRALIQYRNPKNYHKVEKALVMAKRTDLIGFGPKCLIRPRKKEDPKEPERQRKSGRKGNSHNELNKRNPKSKKMQKR